MNAPFKSPRQPDHPVADQFVARWSPRAFSDAEMTEADLKPLLEAARWAPSASNIQPWRLVWGLRGDAGFAAILDCLAPSNQAWAKHAAALVVVASKTTKAAPNAATEEPNPWHAFDAGAAWMSLALQAHLTGWAAHAMGGFDQARLAAAVGLPEDHALHAVVAIGRQGDAAQLSETLQARETPSGRLPVAQTAHRGRFA